jgi:hypothetical protein
LRLTITSEQLTLALIQLGSIIREVDTCSQKPAVICSSNATLFDRSLKPNPKTSRRAAATSLLMELSRSLSRVVANNVGHVDYGVMLVLGFMRCWKPALSWNTDAAIVPLLRSAHVCLTDTEHGNVLNYVKQYHILLGLM